MMQPCHNVKILLEHPRDPKTGRFVKSKKIKSVTLKMPRKRKAKPSYPYPPPPRRRVPGRR